MTLSIKELTSPPSLAEARSQLEDLITSDQGYPETLYQDGAPIRSIVTVGAALLRSGSAEASAIFSGSFNKLASGEFLTELSKNRYGHERIQNTTAQGTANVSSSLGVLAPATTTYDPGTIQFTEGSLTFFNIESITVLSGSVTSGSFECSEPGIVGNLPYNTVVTANPSSLDVWIPQIGTTGTWLTRRGTDQETDKTLKQRNETKWATLGFTTPAHLKYHLIASGSNEVTKVRIDDNNPLGPYSFIAYVSNDQSAVGASTLTELNAIVTSSVAFGSASLQQVKECPLIALDLSGTVYVQDGYIADTVKTNLESAMDTYLNQLPPGGEQRSPYFTNQVTLGDLYKVIYNVDGVSSINLLNPTGTLGLNFADVLTAGSSSYDGLSYVVVDKQIF